MAAFFDGHLSKLVKISSVNDGRLRLGQTVVSVLKFFQSWPTKRTPLQSNLCYAVVMLYCNIILIGLWGHVVKLSLSSKLSYSDVAVDLALLTLGTSGYQYCSYLYQHRHLAKHLLEELGDFRAFEKPPGIEIADARLNAIFKSVIITIIFLTPVLLILLLTSSCEENDYKCGFLYPAYLPGMMSPFRRRCFLFFQITSAWSYALLGTGCLWIGLHMAEYIVLYLRHCQSIAEKTTQILDFNSRKMYVHSLVQYHHRILFLYEKYRTVAKGIFIVHATTTPVVTAMMVHTFRLNFEIQCFLIFAMWMMTLFAVCFMGQRMINESDALADVVYDAIPLDGDLSTAKMLLFMLQRAQKPLIIPAGPLTYCGYILFLAVLKATYSYMALIEKTQRNK